MENNIQTKVNRIGKAGRIVSIVLIVLLGIGALALVLGGIACAILPKDMVEVSLRPVVDVKVDRELIGTEWANTTSCWTRPSKRQARSSKERAWLWKRPMGGCWSM